jgi:hypothetical protein
LGHAPVHGEEPPVAPRTAEAGRWRCGVQKPVPVISPATTLAPGRSGRWRRCARRCSASTSTRTVQPFDLLPGSEPRHAASVTGRASCSQSGRREARQSDCACLRSAWGSLRGYGAPVLLLTTCTLCRSRSTTRVLYARFSIILGSGSWGPSRACRRTRDGVGETCRGTLQSIPSRSAASAVAALA